MSCKHLAHTSFMTHSGPCQVCLLDRMRFLEDENRRLRRELQLAQIANGSRQDVD